MNEKLKRHYKGIQRVRRVHRISAINLMVFIVLVSITGVLLGWKKNSNEWLQPDTYKGISNNAENFQSINSLGQIALAHLNSAQPNNAFEIDRMEIRPSKGVAKVTFNNETWQVQVDATNGEVLHVGKRHSDTIEAIHDGSIVDDFFNLPFGMFKLFYTNLIGLSLLLFVATGFWLWVGPGYIQKLANRK